MDKKKNNPIQISDPTHQDRDINIKAIMLSIGGILLITVISLVAVRGLFLAYERNRSQEEMELPSMMSERQLPPSPRLLVDEAMALDVYLERETALLSQNEWIDQQANLVRIPIERAMDIIAEKGWPVVAKKKPEPADPPSPDKNEAAPEPEKPEPEPSTPAATTGSE